MLLSRVREAALEPDLLRPRTEEVASTELCASENVVLYGAALVGGSGTVEYVEIVLDVTCSSIAVNRLAAGDPDGSACGTIGLPGWDPLLSPDGGGVKGMRDERDVPGFE